MLADIFVSAGATGIVKCFYLFKFDPTSTSKSLQMTEAVPAISLNWVQLLHMSISRGLIPASHRIRPLCLGKRRDINNNHGCIDSDATEAGAERGDNGRVAQE